MNWSCAQTEERLSDFLDGLLTPLETAEFNRHKAGCDTCTRLVVQVGGMVESVHALEAVEPPSRLIPAILGQTLGPRAPKRGWRGWFAWTPVLWQPRFAAGALAVAATLIMLAYGLGITPAKIRKGEVSPALAYREVNRRAHLTYARGVKYVNDLRVVYEIQSKLRPETTPPQLPEAAPAQPGPQEKSQQKETHPGRSANRDSIIYAAELMIPTEEFTRSEK